MGKFTFYLSTVCFSIFVIASSSPQVMADSSQFYEIAKELIDLSPDITIRQTDIQISTVVEKKSIAKYLPQLSGKLDASTNSDKYEDSSNHYSESAAGLTLSQDIIDLQKLYDIKSSRQSVRAARASLDSTCQVVLQEFAIAWAVYWKAIRQMEISKINIDILDQYRENSQFRYDAGELTVTDVRLSQTRHQAARAQHNRFQRELNRTRQVLKEIIKKDPPKDVRLFRLEFENALSHKAASDLNTHPQVIPLIKARTAIDWDIKKERAGHCPRLGLVSSYEYQFSGEYNTSRYPYTEAQIGLELNIPIYNGGIVNDNTKEMLLKRMQQNHKISILRDEIVRDIQTAEFNLEQSLEETHIAKQQLAYAQDTLDGMNEEYEMGTRTSTDVFLVQADMINAQLSVVQAEEQHAQALIKYLFALGKLTLPVLQTFSN